MSDSHTPIPVPRSLPPQPDLDDALDIATIMAAIETEGWCADLADAPGLGSSLKYKYNATPLVTHIDQWADYQTCEEHGIVPPNVTTHRPESDQERTHEEHGTVVPVEIPLTAERPRQIRSFEPHAGHQQSLATERMFRTIAETVLGMLSEGYYDVPIWQDVATPEGRTTVAIGHKRLHVAGVQVGSEAYWRTERQAVEAHYDRDGRIQSGSMIAEDFEPYITDPMEDVRKYPSEATIPTYGAPVDWEQMGSDLDIWSIRDVTDSEREELADAIHSVWPEEALI